MTSIPPELEDAEALLKRVRSLLKEKEAFKDTEEYKKVQEIVEEVTRVVDQKTGQRYYQRYPQRAVNRLTEARKILEKLK